MITPVQQGQQGLSFNGARINILATADNHGNIMRMPIWLRTVENNAKDIFAKSDEESTKNFFAVVGDWFINPSKKGYLTRPMLSNGDLQNLALLKTIGMLRNIVMKAAKGAAYFETLFTAGNHCLDAGDDFLLGVMKRNPMTSLLTNADLAKSPAVKRAMVENNRIVQAATYSIADDKDPDFFHKVLFLGVTIPSMDFYNPGLLKGMTFFDNCNKKDAGLKEEDLGGTIQSVKEKVDKFKEENPKGAVILLSHTGGRISEIICKHVPQINLVLNGHDHKNLQTNFGKTSINSLGKDNEMIKALSLEFDDEGNIVKTSMTPYFTAVTIPDGIEEHPFQKFLNDVLSKDLTPIVSVNEIKSDGETGSKELAYGNELRYSNSYLMNYLTSAIKRVVREKTDPEVFTVAIQSSIVRGSIKDGANNLDIMKVFDGVSEDLSNLRIGSIKGEEMVGLIVENVLQNLKAPTRNTIIHWSDVQVNRSMISDIQSGQSTNNYADAIKVRNQETKEFEPIDLDKDYKMVINEKFLVKDDIEWPGRIRDRFVSMDKTYDELFKDYLASVDYKIHITPKTKEQRII